MPLFNRLLFKISAYLRCRIITGPEQTPYLERYHLFRLPFGYQAYLHRFVDSDPGRGLHNHPWNSAISLVLSGRYEEIRMANAKSEHRIQTRRIGAGHLNWIDGSIFHRINLIDNAESWTLFVHGAKAKKWGFLQTHGKCHAFHDHDTYLDQTNPPLWWKTAPRPVDYPLMRQPTNLENSSCLQS